MAQKIVMIDNIANQMESLKLAKGSTVMPAKKKATQAPGAPLQLGTNVYKIALPKIPVYRFDVDIVLTVGDRKIKVVKKDASDYLMVNHKEQAKATLNRVLEKYPDLFGKQQELYYDLQSTLYTLKNIAIKESKEFILNPEDLPGVFGRVDTVSFIIKPVTEKFSITLDDMSFLNSNDAKAIKHDLAQFIEISSSHLPLFSPDHVAFSTGLSYLKSTGVAVQHENSKLLVTGVQKSARFIEGSGKPEATLVLDAHKAVFHKEGQNLFEKARQSVRNWPHDDKVQRYDIESLNKQFKHLYVETNLKQKRQYELCGVTSKTAIGETFTDSTGKTVSIFNYYQNKYNCTLKHPLAPLAVTKNKFKGKTTFTYLPLEICTVLPNQRVKKDQETPQQTASVIRFCAVVPGERKESIAFQAAQLGLWKGDKSLPYTVEKNPITVAGRHLPAPQIQYGRSQVVAVNANTGKWMAYKGQNKEDRFPYAFPGSPGDWTVAILLADSKNLDDTVKKFAKAIAIECEKRGMKPWSAPKIHNISIGDLDLENPSNYFRALSKMDPPPKFCMVVEDDKTTAHGLIKANEQKFKIVTQGVKLSTMLAFNLSLGPNTGYGKGQTLENLCLKTNMKLGGVNHIVIPPKGFEKIFDKTRMYVGLGISHGSPLTEWQIKNGMKPTVPSVIGLSCNYLPKSTQTLAGDFVYQEARQDRMVSALVGVFKRLGTTFARNHKTMPKEVFIFRVGASEGQYTAILENEVPLIREGLKAANVNAKLVVLVSSRTHHVRIYPSALNKADKAPMQNCKPGTVVDSTIVHPKFPEFFLTSHQTLQGSASTPRYNILVDDTAANIHEHEMVCHMWAYGHQIVDLPTSLPAPAYIADLYAQRGRVVAQQQDLTKAEFLDDNGHQDFEKMTKALSFENSRLERTRVTA